MKSRVLWITRLAAAGLAFAFVMIMPGPESGGGISEVQPSRGSGSSAVSTDLAQRPVREKGPARLRPSEHRSAWAALAARRLPDDERIRLQVEMLKSWAEVDLEGALAAVLAEPWDNNTAGGDSAEALLRAAFRDAFIDRADDVWRMIQDKRFGLLGGSLVRDAWMNALIAKDPGQIVGYLSEMDGSAFRKAVAHLTKSESSPEQARALWEALSKKEVWKYDDASLLGDLAKKFAGQLTGDELRAEMTRGDGPLATLACKALAASLGAAAGFDPASEIAKIPEGMRNAFATELLTLGPVNPATTRNTIGHLVESEQWEILTWNESSKAVRGLTGSMAPAELAGWAVNLPQRMETTEMFHRGIEPYIEAHPEDAWGWISELEEGRWRDRAYAEYSQQALRKFNDPAKSREALDRIQEPEFRAIAEGWRKLWEQDKGWKAE